MNMELSLEKEQSEAVIVNLNEAKSHSEKATELFKNGYNCSQSVFLAFCDVYEMNYDTALRISSSFGAGMGRLREVCGAVSGMFMVAGMIYGYTNPKDYISKTEHYKRIQYLANKFELESGSIICRELLVLEKEKTVQCQKLEQQSIIKKDHVWS